MLKENKATENIFEKKGLPAKITKAALSLLAFFALNQPELTAQTLEPSTKTPPPPSVKEVLQNPKNTPTIDQFLSNAQQENQQGNFFLGLTPGEHAFRSSLRTFFHKDSLTSIKPKTPNELPDSTETSPLKKAFKSAKSIFFTEKGRVIAALSLETGMSLVGAINSQANNEPFFKFAQRRKTELRIPKAGYDGGVVLYDLTEHFLWGSGMALLKFSNAEAVLYAVTWEIKDGILRIKEGNNLQWARGDGGDPWDAAVTLAGYFGTKYVLKPAAQAALNKIHPKKDTRDSHDKRVKEALN